jgi:2-keto-4-pentenoate hydratase/2-oxohepta-3-ene-1,7-dioic acid hydratase in catechol pathway
MRIGRIVIDGHPVHGIVDLDHGVIRLLSGDIFGELAETGESVPLVAAHLCAPVDPGKVVVVGRNYGDRGDTVDHLVIHLKPQTAVVGPGSMLTLPPVSADVRFEGELAVVIGRSATSLPASRYREAILGYTCANDLTAWDVGLTGNQWTKAKGFDTFCPLGPWIRTDLDPADLRITTHVNGELRQDGSTAGMIRDVPALVAEVSELMTLVPGDIILTGTPAGGGSLHDGDEVSVSIAGIGTLTNPVRSRQPVP